MAYRNPYMHGGLGSGWLDGFFTPPPPPTGGGSDGEFALPGNIPGNGLPSSNYEFIVVNNRTYSVTTPAGYNLWPSAAKELWKLQQKQRLSGQSTSSTSSGGADVNSIQAKLNTLPSSLARLAVDGKLGPKTTARIAEFQRLNGLSATGTLDVVTITRILTASGTSVQGNNSSNPPINNFVPPSDNGFSKYIPLAVVGLIFFVLMQD
ncbi:MAG TPA: peptidoglycan-binding domain-containing protein [Pyrinomonadaceae bacterium]|jgi:hypothetical protein|nr:peptidoglycan-binding domain-containing protein [Pyrinomonadaceae bacterium]